MRLFQTTPIAALTILTLTLAATGSPGFANINLELRAVPEDCATRYLDVDLYAVSDDDTDQSISAMDVILAWDPLVLQLQGLSAGVEYPYDWLFSGFPDDHLLDGLNDTWADGNALYQALAQLGTPAFATPEGLLVARFRFEKLQVGSPTLITIPQSFGEYTSTVVYDGTVPGLDVTGTLGELGLLPAAEGDLNCDGLVNGFDIDPFVLALTDPAGYDAAYPDCDIMNADCNCDGLVNGFDIDPFVKLLTGG